MPTTYRELVIAKANGESISDIDAFPLLEGRSIGTFWEDVQLFIKRRETYAELQQLEPLLQKEKEAGQRLVEARSEYAEIKQRHEHELKALREKQQEELSPLVAEIRGLKSNDSIRPEHTAAYRFLHQTGDSSRCELVTEMRMTGEAEINQLRFTEQKLRIARGRLRDAENQTNRDPAKLAEIQSEVETAEANLQNYEQLRTGMSKVNDKLQSAERWRLQPENMKFSDPPGKDQQKTGFALASAATSP